LDRKGVRPATLWDITCDSDGEIEFNEKASIFLHDIDIKKENYYLGFFLLGAYQDILGMKHNLFDRPAEVIVDIDETGFRIRDAKSSNTIRDILESVGHEYSDLFQNLYTQFHNNGTSSKKILQSILEYFGKSNYLE
jgi:arginine decarboxylase